MRMIRVLIVVAAAFVLLPSVVSAQNTTAATAQTIMIGQPPMDFYLSDATTDRWFEFQGRAGRSYCVELVMRHDEMDPSAGAPNLYVYRDLGTNLIGSNINGATQEPDAWELARYCFIAPSTLGQRGAIKVNDNAAGITLYYEMRMVETTLWASWFFVGGDYNSFLLLRNTTDSAMNYTVKWRSPSGTEVGSAAGPVLANSALGINAKTFIADPVTNFNGTVEISYDGAPGALVGQVTSLSATTGLGYDSMLFQRNPW
jgi:hypothetical protein